MPLRAAGVCKGRCARADMPLGVQLIDVAVPAASVAACGATARQSRPSFRAPPAAGCQEAVLGLPRAATCLSELRRAGANPCLSKGCSHARAAARLQPSPSPPLHRAASARMRMCLTAPRAAARRARPRRWPRAPPNRLQPVAPVPQLGSQYCSAKRRGEVQALPASCAHARSGQQAVQRAALHRRPCTGCAASSAPAAGPSRGGEHPGPGLGLRQLRPSFAARSRAVPLAAAPAGRPGSTVADAPSCWHGRQWARYG
jgi:hypothetical protein